jgi:hypothetical protein
MEFAVLGKKVLTYSESPEKAHLELLGKAALPYKDASTLAKWLSLNRFDYQLSIEAFREAAMNYGPNHVMNKFRQVFLR